MSERAIRQGGLRRGVSFGSVRGPEGPSREAVGRRGRVADAGLVALEDRAELIEAPIPLALLQREVRALAGARYESDVGDPIICGAGSQFQPRMELSPDHCHRAS